MSGQLLSRREMLTGTLAGCAGLLSIQTLAAESTQEKRQPRGLMLSCASLAYSDRTWQEALTEIGKLGFRFADLAMFEGWTHISPSALLDPEKHGKKIAGVCARLKVEPIAIHANFNPEKQKGFPGLTTPERTVRKKILEHFQRVLTCARVAEIPLVNIQPGKFIPKQDRKKCLHNAVELLKPMQEQANKQGVVLSFENHTASLGEQPADALFLLEKVPGLRIDFDLSHVVANRLTPKQTAPLMKYVAHVGIRNARPGSFNEPVRAGGKLDFDLKGWVKVLREAKVNAYVSVEYYQPKMQPQIPLLKAVVQKAGVSAG